MYTLPINKTKRIIFTFIILGLLISFSNPEIYALTISIDLITDPLEIGSNQVIFASINDTNPITNAIISLEGANYSLQSLGSNQYSYEWKPTNLGAQLFLIAAQNDNGTYTELSGSYLVRDTTAPLILSASPSGIITTNPVTLRVTTNEQTICKYSTDPAILYTSMNQFTNTNTTTHTTQVSAREGLNHYYTLCRDQGANENSPIVNITFTFDSIAPQIIRSGPTSAVVDTDALLFIETNEDANCRFSTERTSFPSMTIFSTTGGLSHEYKLSDLTDQTYTYYFLCEDLFGNRMNTYYQLTFNVKTPVSASIEFETTPPLKAGLYQLTLHSSRNLLETPTLSYTLSKGSPKYVPLTGSDSIWEGYILIEEDSGQDIGEFSFEGKDTNGDIGREITENKVFIVDTVKPPPITDIDIQVEEGRNTIFWYYPGEKSKFVIYRSTRSGVTHTDYYQTTNEQKFVDKSLEPQKTYYYRVAPFDLAGNEGDLSMEVYGTAKTGKQQNSNDAAINPTETIEQPSAALLESLNMILKDAEKQLIDLDTIEREIINEPDPQRKSVIQDLGLKKRITDSKTLTQTHKERLTILSSNPTSKDELSTELAKIKLDLEKIRRTTPASFEITGDSTYIQNLLDNDIKGLIEKILGPTNQLTNPERYIQNNVLLQKNIEVQTTLYIIHLTQMDKSESEVTLIEKSISNKGPTQTNIMLIEEIPKTLAERASDIGFVSPDYNIVIDDPVIKWDLQTLDLEAKKITYYLNTKADVDTVKTTKTIILTQPDTNYDKSPLTGMAVLAYTGKTKPWVIGLIVGLISVLLLGGYYLYLSRKKGKGRKTVNHTDKTPSKDRTSPLLEKYEKATEGASADQISKIITNANEAINKERFQEAATYYGQAYNHYEKDPSHPQLSIKLTNLYNNLQFAQTLKEAEDCMNNGDALRVNILLSRLQTIFPYVNIDQSQDNQIYSRYRYLSLRYQSQIENMDYQNYHDDPLRVHKYG